MEKKSLKNAAKKTAYGGIISTGIATAALLVEFETGFMEYGLAHGAGLVQKITGIGSDLPERPVINLQNIQKRADEIYAGMKQEPNIIVHAKDGTVIGEFYNLTGKINDVNENKALKNAIVAAEDERFYNHFGIDFGSTMITVGSNIVKKEGRGASTITIQLADSLYDDTLYGAEKDKPYTKEDDVPHKNKYAWKADEWLTAAVLEQVMSKDDILKLYMNNIDFGYSIRDRMEIQGVYAAAEYYFGKEPAKLDYVQSAFLAAAIKNPKEAMQAERKILEGESPEDKALEEKISEKESIHEDENVKLLRKVKWLKKRVSNRVLAKMYKKNFIADEVIIPDREYHEAMEKAEKGDFGFREVQRTKIAPEAYGFVVEAKHRMDAMLEEMQPMLPEGSEIHVYTGLDLKVQEHMQSTLDEKCTALNKGITGKDGKKFKHYEGNSFNGAGVEIDTKSHDIVAMVNGCAYYKKDKAGNIFVNDYNNRATASFWHIGSMIKAIIDMIAFQNGFTSESTIVDEKRVYIVGTYGNTYSPRNYNGEYSGKPYTLKDATCDSVNAVLVEVGFQLCTTLGEKKLVDEFNTFGYELKDYKLPYGIGAFPAALTTVAGSYSIIAENGTATHYRYGQEEQYDDINMKYITKIGIKTRDEKEVIFTVNGTEEQVVSPEITARMDDILSCVVERGTGKSAKRAGMDIRGKTGTAHGNVGFVGYTRQNNLLSVVEVGLENPGTSLPTSYLGGRDAAPIVANELEFAKNYTQNQWGTK